MSVELTHTHIQSSHTQTHTRPFASHRLCCVTVVRYAQNIRATKKKKEEKELFSRRICLVALVLETENVRLRLNHNLNKICATNCLCLVVNVCKIWCVRAYCVRFSVNAIKVKSTGHSFRCCYCLIVWDVYLVDTKSSMRLHAEWNGNRFKVATKFLKHVLCQPKNSIRFPELDPHNTKHKHKRVQHCRLSILQHRYIHNIG